MRQRRLMNQINVVPYIDVMLVLLIIFMVAAPMLPTSTVDLPSVARANQAAVPPLEINIRSASSITLRDRNAADGGSDKPVPRDELVQRLKDAQAQNPEQGVVIAANKNIRYDEVMQVMDLLQRGNIRKVGLLVRQADN